MKYYTEKELNKLAQQEGRILFGIMGWFFILDVLLLIISPLFWLFGSFFMFFKVALVSIIFGVLVILGYAFMREIIKETIKDKLGETENN